DVVPPHAGYENRVPRRELRRAGSFHRVGELREALEVRPGDVHEADRLPGGRSIQRADVEVADLLRRKQREAAGAGDDARDVVREIEVRRDPRAVAEPEARQAVALLQA